MLVFNELRIDEDKHLIIDASILEIEDNEGIETLQISDILVGIGSETDLINYRDEEYWNNINIITRRDIVDGRVKGFRANIILSEEDQKQLIYVKVGMEDSLNILDCNTPTDIVGIVYDKCLITNKVFDYLKENGTNCSDLTNIANYIAKFKGLELAIEGGNFTLANKYWYKFFMNNTTGVSSSNCGCR